MKLFIFSIVLILPISALGQNDFDIKNLATKGVAHDIKIEKQFIRKPSTQLLRGLETTLVNDIKKEIHVLKYDLINTTKLSLTLKKDHFSYFLDEPALDKMLLEVGTLKDCK
ncbi:hypothetical protein ES711_13400 [Gelidibacter salicanalis]|uniref:Uncharacterized protein n=1 Tax=Gelidibacter salicanalis TaxID=291193 RepID=A0A5C7AEV8_9FLAO|nr:hypothetical protein [Gelidibacter salicanalis]TXE06504.1 hypothetical protein ES711_13400 [Gelidibacter salicanalis]